MTFDQLYRSLLRRAVGGGPLPADGPLPAGGEPGHLELLLHPRSHAPVWTLRDCAACPAGEPGCCTACLFQAISRQPDGRVVIDPGRCAGCASCLNACRSGTLTASRDVLPALDAIKRAEGPVYALVAPSFHGQFSERVTPGMLRSAFRLLGFTEMVEVALFADILTLKEALAFDRRVRDRGDFQLASCCCPVWISLIRRDFHRLMGRMPGAVSPMIAAGRTVKALHPDALTVFIGPCLAKKVEAREPELEGAVDWVLTFQEIQDVFEAADIHPETLEDTERGHASYAGRIYGRAGGVSEAVSSTVERLRPGGDRQLRVRRADGIQACREMIEQLAAGSGSNYYEGMGCVGGCVGGPRAILSREEGRAQVERYGAQADCATPVENPYVASLLQSLGFDTVEAFLERSDLYDRSFSPAAQPQVPELQNGGENA